MEEWIDHEARAYRLDIVRGNQKKSYLHLAATEERFIFRPFTCKQTSVAEMNDTEPLIKLMTRYQVGSNDKNKIFGLGPMWEELRKSFAPEEGTVSKYPSGSSHQYNFKAWSMRLTFVNGEHRFFDSADWKKANADGGDPPLARAKIFHMDYDKPAPYVFKLPIGFGCTRTSIKEADKNKYIGLDLLHDTYANQALLNIIVSEPKDYVLNSWTSETYNIRVMRYPRGRGSGLFESYFVTQTQSRSPKGQLKRIKRVWWAPDSAKGQATVYEIDQLTGQCRVSHRDIRDQIVVGNMDGSDAPVQGSDRPKMLSLGQITKLLNDNEGYKLIDEGEDTENGGFRNRHYEKRVADFKIASGSGDDKSNWSGPVSIVKRLSSNSLMNSRSEREKKLTDCEKEILLCQAKDWRL